MIFLDRPITVQQIREVCSRFREGLRVEYKRDFDGNVRSQLPKIVSSIANSQGGALIVGVRALNGVAEAPFDGFQNNPREEFPLTVENICLQGIHPPLLPRTTVVQSDVNNQIFLVIEVEESSEAPHAIENSRKVYVRTSNAGNPYDLAEVELLIDLLKRRKYPLERLHRLLESAEQRSLQIVNNGFPYIQISACPSFPRIALSTSQEVWAFLEESAARFSLVSRNSMKRIPDGAAGLNRPNPPMAPARYVEINKYGLGFVRGQLARINWEGQAEHQQLYFANLFQPLLRLIICAERFYTQSRISGQCGSPRHTSQRSSRGHAFHCSHDVRR